MRRQMSFLLSFVMLFSVLAVNTVYAEPSNLFELKYLEDTTIKQQEDGLKEEQISKDAEEATFEWSILDEGYYELNYYSEQIIDNLGEISKITLGFEVGKDKEGKVKPNTIRVTGKISKWDINTNQYEPIHLLNYQYLFTYTGKYQQSEGKEFLSEISYTDNIGTVAQSLKEISFRLGKGLNVRAFVKDNKLKVWTNGINKGYLTDFTLNYSNSQGEEVKKTDTKAVFPGVSNVQIVATHLKQPIQITTSGALKSVEKINVPAETGIPAIIAGSEPGIKVEFERPRMRVGNTFKYIDENSSGSDIKGTLKLYPKLKDNDQGERDEIQVDFNLGNASGITGNIIPSDVVKKVHLEKINESDEENNKMALYFSKNADFYKDGKVIVWPLLEKSMILGGEITFSGKLEVGGKSQDISTGNIGINTGHTYIEYKPEQINVGETTLVITPYKFEQEVTYEVYYINGDNILNESKTLFGRYKFQYDATYPDKKLEISIPSNEVSKFMVKTILSDKGVSAKSQEIVYNPKHPNVTINPYTPEIREVDNIYVIPESSKTSISLNIESAGFDISWSAPSKQQLKEMITEKGKLYFELNLMDSAKRNKAVIAVFEASVESKDIIIKQLGNSQGVVSYDETNNRFIATKVILKEMEKSDWEKIKLKDKYEEGTSYPDIVYEGGLSYQIPNLFYLSMRSVLDPDTSSTEQLKFSTNESALYPLTLDATTEVVPAPEVISNNKTSNSTDIELEVSKVSIKKFVEYMLTPGKWSILNSNKKDAFPGTYEVVLYQDTYLKNNTTHKNEISDHQLEAYMDGDNEKVWTVLKPLTDALNVLDATLDNQGIIKALREGKIIKFNYNIEDLNADKGSEGIKIDFKGLDANQSYYVRVRTVLESERTKGDEKQIRVDKSLFSNRYGFTTHTESKPINPDEEVPPTPKKFTALAEGNSLAVLNWQDPDMKVASDNILSYEIIRVTSQKIDQDVLNEENVVASDVVTSQKNKEAVLLNQYQQVSKEGEIYYELTDDTLQSNTVYYYYIRTVYKGLYSEWIYQPITTPNIEKPMSLKGYNPTKTTVDISFLAKVPYHSFSKLLDFKVAIQAEDEGEWTIVSKDRLSRQNADSEATVEGGYYYYEYRISGLKPGKSYNVKVCVIDLMNETTDGEYQQSLYSDSISIRTEYDEEEEIKDNKYKEYLDRFDQETEKLKKKTYWMVEKNTIYKYRAEYLNSDMSLKKHYQLVSQEDSNHLSYYLPASVISQMNELGVTLEVVQGDQTISIRPQTILETISEIKEAIELKTDRELSDYYVVISVNKSSYTSSINGEACVSPKIDIEMDIAYMKQEDVLTEADILEALNDIIEEEREDFMVELEKRIDKGVIVDSLLQEILDDFTEDIEKQHIKRVSKIMTTEKRKTLSISAIEKPILITYKGKGTSVNGYYEANTWVQVTTYSASGNTYIEANGLGAYIFTGRKQLTDTVPSLAPYQNFIDQYRLDDFFVLDSYMIQTAASKQQAYGALARVVGASRGTDYVAYLISKEIKGISKIGLNNKVRQDESIYLIMQGYEVLHHRNTSSVVIKNRQSVSNIGAFQPIYRPYIYAAVELKIVNNPNTKVMPSKQMTSEELIKMLYQIQA